MFRDFLKKWVVPYGWRDLIMSLKKQNTTRQVADDFMQFDLENLSKFKNIHRGQRCFILASGPSIKEQDLTVLENEFCIAVSQFFLHPDIATIKPQYHCFAPQHSPFDDSTSKIIFDNYSKCYKFPVKCFIGTSSYNYSYSTFLERNPQYNIDASYINYEAAPDLDEHNYTNSEIWDITKRPFGLMTVVYEAIQVANYMGFTEIYLLGVDHDYINDLQRDGHHFYAESQSYSDKEHLSEISLERWFLIYHTRWKQYRLMRIYLDSIGVKVFNATPKSMLDVFPKVNLEDIIAE